MRLVTASSRGRPPLFFSRIVGFNARQHLAQLRVKCLRGLAISNRLLSRQTDVPRTNGGGVGFLKVEKEVYAILFDITKVSKASDYALRVSGLCRQREEANHLPKRLHDFYEALHHDCFGKLSDDVR
jgi:hypothetical protein